MMNALKKINTLLSLEADVTFAGDELKGVCPDPDDGGVCKFYLSATDCEDLAAAFTTLAAHLRQ